jgi:hypothetical protein
MDPPKGFFAFVLESVGGLLLDRCRSCIWVPNGASR